jgi:hypothetical protein
MPRPATSPQAARLVREAFDDNATSDPDGQALLARNFVGYSEPEIISPISW